jgi:hypothetical protein
MHQIFPTHSLTLRWSEPPGAAFHQVSFFLFPPSRSVPVCAGDSHLHPGQLLAQAASLPLYRMGISSGRRQRLGIASCKHRVLGWRGWQQQRGAAATDTFGSKHGNTCG